MVKVIIISNLGQLSELNVSKFQEDELYKKCGFRKADGFENRQTWENIKIDKTKYSLSIFSRDYGKANSENKYELPPPIDNDLYFGKIAAVAYSDGEPCDLTISLWNKIYESLMGGFEDLDDPNLNDESESDELDDVDPEDITNDGYLKDDFVVDDSDEYYEGNCGSELEEEEYDEDDSESE